MAETIEVNPELSIPAGEIAYRASRSGGPGGQHVNTSSTRVELVWDLEGSPSLTPEQKERLRSRLASRINSEGMLAIASSKTRSQLRNREDVTERFAVLLRRALEIQPPRKRTRPPLAAHEERLKEKKERSERKQARRPVEEEM
jgi:ribosome-associated protein